MQASGKRWITYPSRNSAISMWCFGDLHLGNQATELDRLRRDIKKVEADPGAFWVGVGDYCDYIGVGDKRFDPACLPDDLLARDLGQLGAHFTKLVRDLFSPIKHKCLGLALGNHETKYQRANQQEHLHGWLCTELGVPNLGYSALFDVAFVRMTGGSEPKLLFKPPTAKDRGNTFTRRFYIHHGAGAAATPGGKINRLIGFMQAIEADVYIIGHVHDQVAKRLVRLGADEDCTKLTERVKLGVVSGSYLKTYAQDCTSYGEEKGYSPTALGAIRIEVMPDKGEVYANI
jgi:hypothetical protein